MRRKRGYILCDTDEAMLMLSFSYLTYISIILVMGRKNPLEFPSKSLLFGTTSYLV